MLENLIKNIDKSLVSYIKMVERQLDHLDFTKGIDGQEGIVNQAKLLTHHRREDIKNIYRICHHSDYISQPPIVCIKAIFNYVQSMKTGFFSSNSKLRDAVLQAIDCYDAGYIKWPKGKPVLDERIARIAAAPNLVATNVKPESLRSDDSELREQITHLNIQLSGLLQNINEQNKTIQELLKKQEDQNTKHQSEIAKLEKTLADTNRDLGIMRSDNLMLKEDIERLQSPQQKTEDTTSESSLSLDEEESKRSLLKRA